MKDALIVFAQFEQFQNRKLFRILDTLTDEQRKTNRSMGYTGGSIHGALDRIAGTLGMGAKMLTEAPGQPGPGRPGDPGEPGGPGGPAERPTSYDEDNYEVLKGKIAEIDQAYLDGFQAITEERCMGGGIPLYDMCMKGFLVATSARGAISQVLAEMGVECDLIFGALLSED